MNENETTITKITENKSENYIKDRVDDQIDWYDKKSIEMQKKFKQLKRITIFISALIPIISLSKISNLNTDIIVSLNYSLQVK